ncbi:MAG: hypothetical protein IPN45_06570 [Actinomycetales bacterium]|nr:hypothetical protein [Actinomycetales bacterium]
MPRTPQEAPRRRRWRVIVTLLVVGLVYAGYVGVRGLLAVPHSETCVATADGGSAELTPEQTSNAAVITGVAVRRGLPTRAATIAIATAMQESKLRNLRFGDRDSVGLFQQRPSQGWGTEAQILDPVYASGAFFDVLVKVKDYETRPLTEVAQQVQRSAYPTAYARHEAEARALAAGLTGVAPATLSCDLDPPAKPGTTAAIVTALAAHTELTGRAADGAVSVEAAGATAWSVASWAVAHADALGITAVRVADHTWSREDGTWIVTPAHAGVTISVSAA